LSQLGPTGRDRPVSLTRLPDAAHSIPGSRRSGAKEANQARDPEPGTDEQFRSPNEERESDYRQDSEQHSYTSGCRGNPESTQREGTQANQEEEICQDCKETKRRNEKADQECSIAWLDILPRPFIVQPESGQVQGGAVKRDGKR